MNGEVDLAREGLYRFLAAALRGPHGPGWQLFADPASREAAAAAADLLRAEASGRPGFGEPTAEALTLRPLEDFLGGPGEAPGEEYYRVFGLLGPRECPPYETEFCPEEPFLRAQQMADVAGFYRAFGLAPSHGHPERPDYLPLELEFMAFLLLKKRLAGGGPRAEVCAEVEAGFYRDHLAWWLPAFAAGLRRRAGGGLYAALGELLAAFAAAERARLGLPPPRLPLRQAAPAEVEEEAGCAGCPS
jgi:TorA maturation chaperone TorD